MNNKEHTQQGCLEKLGRNCDCRFVMTNETSKLDKLNCVQKSIKKNLCRKE